MANAPTLPDNAPFAANQRAWINGFLAGLLNDPDAPAAARTATAFPVSEAAPSPSPAAEPEDFPWHDPALELDDRMALAEGRSRARVLMAAMAQLDCGQCGYLCETYSEAIARGDEKDLTRGAPGGNPPARKLKEFLSPDGVPAPPVSAVPAAAAPAPAAVPPIAASPGTNGRAAIAPAAL